MCWVCDPETEVRPMEWCRVRVVAHFFSELVACFSPPDTLTQKWRLKRFIFPMSQDNRIFKIQGSWILFIQLWIDYGHYTIKSILHASFGNFSHNEIATTTTKPQKWKQELWECEKVYTPAHVQHSSWLSPDIPLPAHSTSFIDDVWTLWFLALLFSKTRAKEVPLHA